MRLIDADKLVEDNKEIIDCEIDHPIYQNTVREILDAQPTIEPKRGRWISQKEEGWAGGGVTRCSRCNFGYAWGAFHEVEEFNFCPNCGARMEASDD